MHKGSCLCGAVSFEVTGELPAPSACHCTQCRKHSGHFEASTDLPRSAVSIRGADALTWYFTENVRRGFCSTCGSSRIAIAMGAFDGPTHTRLEKHIFVATKGDYYELNDGLPQFQP